MAPTGAEGEALSELCTCVQNFIDSSFLKGGIPKELETELEREFERKHKKEHKESI